MSIRVKLFLVLLCTAAAVVAGMYAIMRWSFERGFIALVETQQGERVAVVVERLAEEYSTHGGWEPLLADRGRWVEILMGDRAGRRLPRWARRYLHQPDAQWPPSRHPPPDPSRVQPLELRLMLLDADRALLIGMPEDVASSELEPIVVDGERVGWLGVLPGPALSDLADIRFVERQQRTFAVVAIGMVLLAGVVGLPLAATLTRRLGRLTEATRALALGRYDARVVVGSPDELGALATDVNDLAAALGRAERGRREWVADISHELRTPLSVLRAELEALQDGMRPLDARAVNSLHADALRLGRLIDDLYDLAMSDLGALSYRKEDLDALEVLDEVCDALRGEFEARNIEVRVERDCERSALVHADADRLAQLFRNLLTNTLRYTDRGGRLEIRADAADGRLVIELDDTAPGVPDADVAKLFDRFHRVEASRSRAHGGAGLGLAICHNIVAAHEGRIEARPSRLGGLAIRLELPIAA